MKISGRQLAAARSLLNWSQDQLAAAAEVSHLTILHWENEHHSPRQATVDRVVQVIESRGVEFTNGGAPGVRFKPKPGATQHETAGE